MWVRDLIFGKNKIEGNRESPNHPKKWEGISELQKNERELVNQQKKREGMERKKRDFSLIYILLISYDRVFILVLILVQFEFEI